MSGALRLAVLVPALGAVSAALVGQAGEPSDQAAIAIYRAFYEVEYKGRRLGTSEFAVSYDEEREAYQFASRTIAKGLLRLVRPNPVTERSHFVIENGAIRPLEFWYEDGSRKGEDNLHVVFDWQNGVAVVSGAHGKRELALAAGTLDRGSLQVALMRDLAINGEPGNYLLADADSVAGYEYIASGEQTLTTGIGEINTLVFMQQREDSSRSTWLWVAPALGYLPVRIEQRKDGETQTAFLLESVEGLGQTRD